MSFISLMLSWYHKNMRPLPWRETKSVYHVWLSEIILQQTRVNQGMRYYYAFTETFPTVNDLANANEQEVLNLWQGLGYYSRARNLHKTAKIIVNEYNGIFPNSFAALKKLPGIGPYTAAAISSICFDEKVPAIDGNAYRVYSRVFGLDKDISDSNAHKFYFKFAIDKMSPDNPGDFNQAIMELGATVCLPSSPLCMFCPVQNSCVAFNTGQINKLPIKTKKVKVKKRYLHYFFVQNNKTREFFIKKRTQKGVWQNLFDFPLIETQTEKLDDNLYQKYQPKLVSEFKHILTHQRLFIKIYTLELDNTNYIELQQSEKFTSISQKDIEHYPFPKPIFSFLDETYNNKKM